MACILSTRKLSISQKNLILNAGLGLVECNFIKTTALPFKHEDFPKNIIFTSIKAAKIVLDQTPSIFDHSDAKKINIFCVGNKTKTYLEQNDVLVVENAANAQDLALRLVKNHAKKTFHFFCGQQRLSTLPEILKTHKIRFHEIIVYQTILTPSTFNRNFDGLLFLSPSAVKSYISKNSIGAQPCFCIGPTTGQTANKHSQNVYLANRPSIENVIVQAVKHLAH